MKRTIAIKNETKKTSRLADLIGVDGDHPVWRILIPYLDFHCQFKISQLSHHCADLVELNAEYQLKKLRRRIKEDKYM